MNTASFCSPAVHRILISLLVVGSCFFGASTVLANDGRGSEGRVTPSNSGRANDPTARAMADSALALSDRDPGRSMTFALSAIDKARRASDLSALHDGLNAKRYVHYLRGEHELLLQTSMEALRVAQDLGNERAMGDDHGWMSVALMELRQPEKAYQHAQRSLDHMRASNDSVALARGLCDMSNACLPVNKHGEAIMRATEAIRIYEALHDSSGSAFTQNLMGGILMDQKRWSDALPTLLKAYRYIAKHGEDTEQCWIERDIAMTYAGLGRWTDAEHFLKLAETKAHRLNAVREYPSLLSIRMDMLEARGEVAQALLLARQCLALNDSLIRADVAGRIATMNAVHDVDEQQNEIERLLAANTELTTKVESAKAQGRWWLLGFGVLLSIAAVAAFQLRFNRRAVQRLRDKNQQIRELTEQVHARNMDMQRQQMRLTETMLSEEEKDILLKEIHHRVKNNLQVVNTLLKLQAIHLGDPKLEGIFDEAQGRVRSMALVHEHIYKVGDLSRVNVKAHVLALAEGILQSHGLDKKVRIDLQVTYDKASVETLIPLSLLLNELITNSAKHAFHGREHGVIRIVLRRLPDGSCELLVSDDGTGLHHDQLCGGDSFGMDLVNTLSKQVNGSIRLLKGEGTTFELSFRSEERALRAAS
ncbi:MAG: hypothetical protein IPP26_08455 [Flavobacteriales bacterium]|nr:hypothetical protein [Flavobacteriales bacterium]